MEFTRKPTDPDRIIIEPVELPEGHALLIADVPDYVNLPREIIDIVGYLRANVLKAEYRDFNGQVLLHYKLDVKINGKDLWVAKGDQFYWHLR